MEIPELPTLAIRLNQIISIFVAIRIHRLELFLAVTDFLARHAAPFDPHLPIGLAYVITVAKNILLNTAVLVLVRIQTLVLVIGQICRLRYGDDASSSLDPQNAVHLPSPAGPQDATISPSPPPHPIPAENPDLSPPLTGSPVAPEVVNDGNASPSPTSGHDRAVPEISSLLQYMATFLLERYFKEKGVVDLAVSIDVFQVAEGLRPQTHPHRSSTLSGLAVAFFTRYKRSGRGSDLSKATDLHQEALSLRRPGEHVHSSSIKDVENETRTWFERHGGDFGLSDFISPRQETQPGYHNRVLEDEKNTPTDPSTSTRQHQPAPEEVGLLDDIAISLIERYQQEGGPADLANAIQLLRHARSLLPSGHPGHSILLNSLAVAVEMRYNRNGEEHDLEEAIQLHREALSLQPPGHPNRSMSLNNLAIAVTTRYERDGGEHGLEEAIQLYREALSLFPPGHPNRSVSLNNLAAAVKTRYERDGGEHGLEEAIQLYREALSLYSPGHPDRSMSLNNLANAVRTRYKRDGREHDLEEAIQLHREALSLFPPGHPKRPGSLNNLAVAVFTRHERDGGEHDLEEAIQLQREALSLRPPGHPKQSGSLNNLAAAVQIRYWRDGGEHDLEEAIQLQREALSLQPPGHPDRSISLSNLAVAIQARYERDGREHDLEEAIQLNSEALSLQPPGHPDRSGSLNNLSNVLQKRHERDGGEHDLEEAIQLQREALSLQPLGHPKQSGSLNNLAAAVQIRYERDGGEHDLEEAIQLQREALSLQPPGHPFRSISLNNLAVAAQRRYERDGREHDLEQAILLHREGLSFRPLGHPERSSSLNNLANVVEIRYERDGGDQDLEEAIRLLLRATAATTSPIPDRLRAALRWIDMAIKHNPASALDAYQSAFTLMGSALALGRSMQDRRTNLLSHGTGSRPTKSLALDAAVWALSSISSDPKLAVELLDQGRNVLLASIGQFRADLSDVRQKDPALADEFYRISRVLDSAILSGQEISAGRSAHEDATSRYKKVSAQWEDVVTKIRLLPGCESFLLPMPYIKLQEAAVGGPVIVILVGKKRSTAVIVTAKGVPYTVDLPDAPEAALKKLYEDIEHSMKTLPVPDQIIKNILSDLWDILVQPIIQELQDNLRIPTGSRIWWYPTSWASFLPLHAAGLYKKNGSNVPKLYVSSYTPTLQALRRSRNRLNSRSNQSTASLIVSQPETPGHAKLPSTNEEVEVVCRLVPSTLLLSGDQGTKANVLNELRDYPWVHLACHGDPDPSDPFKSHFALHDGPLTLQDIITNDLTSADFAYLAACHSAAPDRTPPDEGLALAGGMQFAGFKSVVGTLWQMADGDGPILAEEFYKGLAERSGDGEPFDCTKAAESLHNAVRELRRKTKAPFFRWINLVHYGI